MKTSKVEILTFLAHEFPQSQQCLLEELIPNGAIVRYRVSEQDLRPRGTVSGPTMMTIADFALYVSVLADVGLYALAVTTQMNIHFLRKPLAGRDLIAKCQLLKSGKKLVVGQVEVYSEGQDEAVAHVTGSYALPSTDSRTIK